LFHEGLVEAQKYILPYEALCLSPKVEPGKEALSLLMPHEPGLTDPSKKKNF